MSARTIDAGGRHLLHLTMALSPSDQVHDLASGAVRAEGIALTPLLLPVEEIFYRFTRHGEWQVSELSFAKTLALVSRGDAPIVPLPVFTSRMFRHSAIYVRNASGIRTPQDLQGRRVGIPEWAQTAGVWVRGMLAEQHGVDLRRIEWVQAGVNQPGRQEKVALALPAGIRCEPRTDASLDAMLRSGEIDAAISARPPEGFVRGEPHVQRLFSDFRSEELAYWRATGVFPIMHTVVLQRAAFEADRWIAMNLYQAFAESLRRSVERLSDITAAAVPLPWASALAAEMKREFGDALWPYGIDANRKTLDTFCRFAHAQGVSARAMTADDLFPPEVRSTVRV